MRNRCVASVSVAVLMAACSSERMPSEKPYSLPAEVTLDAHAERGPQGELYIIGSTNFPDGMKMWVHVGRPKAIAFDNGVHVRASKFTTSGLWEEVRNQIGRAHV